MNPQQVNTNPQTENIEIDLGKWFSKILSYWWLFVLGLGIALPCGYYYLRYAVPEFETKAILLIKDTGRSTGISEERILLEQGLTGGGKSMDNEISILKSLPLMEKVVDRLDANIAFYRKMKYRERELYKTSPFVFDTLALTPKGSYGFNFWIEIKNDTDSTFILKRKEDGQGQVQTLGVPFENELGYFQISHDDEFWLQPGIFRVSILNVTTIAIRYKFRLKIERVGDQVASSILELKLQDNSPEKSEDILNTLIQIYNEEEIEDENTVLKNTLDFIDERVKILDHELDSVETGIELYKSNNEIITQNAEASMNFTLNEIRASVNEISAFEVQKSMLQSIEEFLLTNQKEFELIPTNLIADNPSLASLVAQHNQLVLQIDRLSTTATEENPARKALESELLDIRNTLLQTVKNLRKDLDIPIAQIEKNIKDLRGNMRRVPTMEKRLLEQLRMQTIKERLFLYLLQKREETALSEAITTANTRVIDYARSSGGAVYPKNRLIYIACGVLGILIPLMIITLITALENRIESEEELKKLTTIPILGRIGFSKTKEEIVVKSGDRSAINEMFRLLRTNLNYLNVNQEKQILMVTSSVSGEGKSFIALNLAITLALSKKKVIILGMDLRKPKLFKYLGKEENNIGITNYLIGQNSISEVTQQFEENENLHFITSGPTPPNPAELILGNQMEMLLETLSEHYDYVILDTPPIGLVSDALLLRKFISNILVVVRHKYTKKVMLRNLEHLHQNGELPKSALILNAIKSGKRYYGYGGYGYGYGYGQGYYTN